MQQIWGMVQRTSLGKRLLINIRPDNDFIKAHAGHVAIGDGVLRAVGHGEEEWLEGHFVEPASYLMRCNHDDL